MEQQGKEEENILHFSLSSPPGLHTQLGNVNELRTKCGQVEFMLTRN